MNGWLIEGLNAEEAWRLPTLDEDMSDEEVTSPNSAVMLSTILLEEVMSSTVADNVNPADALSWMGAKLFWDMSPMVAVKPWIVLSLGWVPNVSDVTSSTEAVRMSSDEVLPWMGTNLALSLTSSTVAVRIRELSPPPIWMGFLGLSRLSSSMSPLALKRGRY